MAFDGMRATVIPRQANTLSPAIPFVGKHVVSPRFVTIRRLHCLNRKVVLREFRGRRSGLRSGQRVRREKRAQGGKLLSSGPLNGGCGPESSGDSGNPRAARLVPSPVGDLLILVLFRRQELRLGTVRYALRGVAWCRCPFFGSFP
jgi:hypothetical protein